MFGLVFVFFVVFKISAVVCKNGIFPHTYFNSTNPLTSTFGYGLINVTCIDGFEFGGNHETTECLPDGTFTQTSCIRNTIYHSHVFWL